MKPTLFLLDAYALIFRAYYGLIRSPRINSRGENVSAIFGFVNTLEDILRKNAPDFIAVAFDPAGGTFRHEASADYKANRDATPEDIRAAVPIIKELLAAYRIPVLEVPGFEADDVIGTMAKRGAAEGLDVQMVTPDKDYAQLVGPGITMRRPSSGASPWEILGTEEVLEKYGLNSTAQVIDLLALMGDKADNIPGCPGVGEKTAVKLLTEFGSVESLIERSGELKGAIQKKVSENAEQIRFSKFLATIRTDVPVEISLEALRRQEPDVDALTKLFERLEFRTFLKRLGAASSNDASENSAIAQNSSKRANENAQNLPSTGQDADETPILEASKTGKRNYIIAESVSVIEDLAKKIATSGRFASSIIAREADSVMPEIVGIAISGAEDEAFFVPLARKQQLQPTLFDSEEAEAFADERRRRLEALRPLFESETLLKVGHDMKTHLHALREVGIALTPPLFDVTLSHYVIQPEMRHSLDFIAPIYLRLRPTDPEDVIGPKARGEKKTLADAPTEALADWACEDADLTLRLVTPLEEEMARLEVSGVFRDIEMPLLPVLARMEANGVVLDTRALAVTGDDFHARLQALESEIYALADHTFNIASPGQVGTVLFEELALSEKAKKTKSGQYSTSEEILEALREKHPIVGKILAYRGLKKLLSTYIDALPKLINSRTHRIHTSFNQAVTATGRLSSSNPNLQNIPVRGDDGREIRKAFVPEPGCTFFSADYSQIELRIMAQLSGDAQMIADFREGHDIHTATAARIFKKDIADVTRDERRKAKTANFGIIYGISAFGLAERMEVSRSEAKALIESYFETYPAVRAYMAQSVETAREKGFIETQFGRRRYLPDITSRNAVVRSYAERNAVNAPIQGTAADIIKVAMIRIDRRMQEAGLASKMILQVHDELNFSVAPGELDTLRTIVISEMEAAWQADVPLLADCGAGENWLEAH